MESLFFPPEKLIARPIVTHVFALARPSHQRLFGYLNHQYYECFRELFYLVVWGGTWSVFNNPGNGRHLDWYISVHLILLFPWFSCCPIVFRYHLNIFIPKFMIPLRNNHMYWFPLSVCSLLMNYTRHSSSSGQWLQLRCTLSAILCPPCLFCFLLFLLMHILRWPLHWKFSLAGTLQLMDSAL